MCCELIMISTFAWHILRCKNQIFLYWKLIFTPSISNQAVQKCATTKVKKMRNHSNMYMNGCNGCCVRSLMTNNDNLCMYCLPVDCYIVLPQEARDSRA